MEERREGRVERFAGADAGVVDAIPRASPPHFLEKPFEGLQIAVAESPWIAIQEVGRFEVVEADGTGEIEIQFVVVEDVDRDDIMPALPQEFQYSLPTVEEIEAELANSTVESESEEYSDQQSRESDSELPRGDTKRRE